MKKIGKWFLLFLSVFYTGYTLKALIGEFLSTYVLFPYYLFLILPCATASYYLAGDLGVWPWPDEPDQQEPAAPEEHPIILKFIEENRELLERALAGPVKIELANGCPIDKDIIGRLIPPGRHIGLSGNVDRYRCNYRLRCGKDGEKTFVRFFTRDCRVNVPFDPENTDHQDLLDHLNWMIRNYGAIVRAAGQTPAPGPPS